ncbi:MAG: branched-chain amino acid ABC transporter permease [Lachnospiraceae bacterium]|nr:branched-chain amino acid ABC transporter permease [Lachnospiraceae bacterium]
MKKKLPEKYGFLFVIFLFWLVLTLLSRAGMLTSHFSSLLVPMTYYAIAAVALNLCVGILGELSIGHAGFMCIGAFSSAIFSLLTRQILPGGVRFFLAFVVGILFAALFGFLIGIPVLRLKGDYLAIVTLAFGEIIKNILQAVYLGVDADGVHIALNMTDFRLSPDGITLIKGAQGVSGTPRDSSFTVAVIVLLLSLIIVQNLIDSRDGRAIMSIRDNRIAAEATGIHVTHYKMLAFTISAAIAGAAGVLFSHNVTTMTNISNYFGYNASIMLLVYVVLGGIGNIRGSVVAAMILYLLPEMMRGLNRYRMLIYAIVLILMMLFNWAPALVALRKKLWQRIRDRRPAVGKEA